MRRGFSFFTTPVLMRKLLLKAFFIGDTWSAMGVVVKWEVSVRQVDMRGIEH